MESPQHRASDASGGAAGRQDAIASLMRLTLELNAAPDLVSGLERFAERLREFVPYDTLGILLMDDLGKELRFELAVGYPQGVADHWRFGMGQGIVGTVAQTGRPILLRDVAADPRYIDACPSTRSELALPLIAKERTIGVLDLGSVRLGLFTPEHQDLLVLVAGHLADAIERARIYRNMLAQARTLSLLHEVSRDLTSILDRGTLVARVAELVKGLIRFDVFSLMLWNEETRLLEPSVTYLGDTRASVQVQSLALGHGLCGTAAALRQPVRVPNVHLDPRWVRCSLGLETRSELVVPLVFKDRLIGVLDLESAEYDAFSAQSEQLLSTLCSSLSIALENARLYEKLRLNEQALEGDLATARELQKQLLPKATPWLPGLQLAVAYEPARHLGGDFYDVLPYGEGRAAIALCDVAGKGTSAALYGTLVIGILREYAGHSFFDPAHVLADLNEKLTRLAVDGRSAAMAFALYDSGERTLTLANSGLPFPHLVRAGRPTPVEVAGVPLGLIAGRVYEQATLHLQLGDVVVICSDGVQEALDRQEEQFGSGRLHAVLTSLAGGSARDIADGIVDAVRRHSGEGDLSDDCTVLVMKAQAE
jgi:sigma-B regulation protein RsbU (phosphoserine phosphatase)